MAKKEISRILFFLLLTSTACTSADYAAMAHIEYGTVIPENAPISTEAQLEVTMPARATATISPSWRVCTGVENGTLRVRKGAGTGEVVVAFLEEGAEVEIIEEKEPSEGGAWAKIKSPLGWINKRFVCGKE